MPLKLDNVDDIAAALDAAELKAGGTIAERLEARQHLREVAAELRADRQGFKRNLDAIEHAFIRGVQAGASGTPTSGPGLAQAFADYEADRRQALGLPPA